MALGYHLALRSPLVFAARDVVPEELTASTGKVGVRFSSHPVASGLVHALGDPVTAPSANLSGRAPPTDAPRSRRISVARSR